MPGYNPQQVAHQVRNGNTVAVMIGDTIVAFAQTVGHQVPFGTEQLYGIGTSKPQEIQQLRVSPQISVDAFNLTAQGIKLLAGNVNLTYTLAGKQYELHIMDGSNNATLYTYVGCQAQNFAQAVPANAPIRDSISFLAMDVLDNKGNSIMDTGENAIDVGSALVAGAIAASNLGLAP